MKSFIAPLACVTLFGLAQPAIAQDARPVRGLLSMGFVSGGETLSSFEVVDGFGYSDTTNVRAGGKVDLRLGLDWRFAPAWSSQFSLGYVTGGVNADNGSANFRALPLEALVHLHVSPVARIGVGLRKSLSAKYEEDGVAGNASLKFSNTPGLVAEAEWIYQDTFGVKVRLMKETFKEKQTGIEVDGSRFGVTGSWYF